MAKKSVNIIVPQFRGYKQEIVLFGDLEDMTPVKIILPEPPNKRNVINYNRPTTHQKWERISLPKSFDKFKGMAKSDIYPKLKKEDHHFIMDEYRKMEEGSFFFNHGELVYLTKTNYLYLQWWKPNFGYPLHRHTDRNVFYHWDLKIVPDNNCAGIVEIAKRRDGKSARSACAIYLDNISHKNRFAGIQSKTDDDAEKYMQKNIALPWRNLPFFLQPNYDHTNNPRSEMRWFTPTTKGKESQKNLGSTEQLESWIQSRAAVETAFDGEKLHRSVDDEAGKLKLVDIRERWRIKRPCLVNERGDIVGKEWMTTTVEEMTKGGGQQFFDVFDGSDPNPERKIGQKPYLDGKGRTPTWLHRHFTPAYEGFIIDEYGNSKIEESKAALESERRTTDGKRMYPFTVRECFRSAGNECHFNIEIINNRLDDFVFGNPRLAYGDFEWKKIKDEEGKIIVTNDVEFVHKPKEKAKFVVSYLFERDEMANKKFWRSIGGKTVWFPNNTNFGCAGGDPFKYNVVAGNKKSMGAGAVFRAHDPHIDHEGISVDNWKTHRFVCTYRNRPSTKEKYGDDMIKMCVYYGIKMNPEINVSFLWDHFDASGYGGYLLYHRDHTGRLRVTPGENTMGDKSLDRMFDAMEEQIEYHGHREEHPEILEECRDVEYDKVTKADLFVACAHAKTGCEQISFRKVQEEKVVNEQYFHTFDLQLDTDT